MKCRLAFAILATLAIACTSAPRPQAGQADCRYVESGFGPPGKVPIKAETVASGLEVPWGVAFLPDGELLVTERPGRVQKIGRNGTQPVKIEIRVAGTSESGLLGIALHPKFSENRFFYLYYTTYAKDGPALPGAEKQNRVQRYRLSADGRSATADKLIVGGIPAAVFHDGGRLRFGPDGMLYIGTGDARDPDSAQKRTSLAGKILRVTPDGEVPADNPFPKSPVFIEGVRNTQGFDWWDATTLIVTDHGPSGELRRRGGDEVSLAIAGANLGWPELWGCEATPGRVTPFLTWKEAVPPGGAALYRGDKIPQWKGSLLIGTLGSTHLHRVALSPAGKLVSHEVYFSGEPPAGYGRLREVIEGPDGYLYVTTSNCDSRGSCPRTRDQILRLKPG